MRSNGIDISISSLSALDVFMEPSRSARIRCHVCHRMQKVDRGLMIKHFDANADDCPGSFTHYIFDWSYERWVVELGLGMDGLHKQYSGAHAIDPRVRHATRVSPVRYPSKPAPLHRRPTHPTQTEGHAPARLAAFDGARKLPTQYPAPTDGAREVPTECPTPTSCVTP